MSASPPIKDASRRDFLQKSSAAVVGGSLAATLGAARTVHAAGSDILKVGLIGCGGRGSGAAVNAMRAEENLQLVALADAFADRLDDCKQIVQRQIGKKYAVKDETCFVGFDAYKQLLETDVDVVLLCTPPHFRPAQLRASIEAGKHVFCEKPVAVDPTGVRSVLETVELAKQKNLSIVSGLCWRYDLGVRETIGRIKDGAIGDIVTIQENYLTGTLWHRGRQDSWSEMEYQMRNWLYFAWLSGDHIVEQHIHSLDKALWLMDDEPPVSCVGLGGRQVRSEEKWGHIFDHFAVCYEWANGAKTFAYTRQMKGCHNEVEDHVLGTKGAAKILKHEISQKAMPGDEGKWKYKGPKPSMYNVEHKELFAGIRSGDILNNGKYMSYSTLLAIMGREACYTGEKITWEKAINSKQDLSPKAYAWTDIAVPEVAVPGKTKLA
ncbi:MAG: Gfo/Idh/MocA family oxidoreductase [Pirellulaceae bacterium]|nr:Gfo/Idh/MocA family oxidoreductase [Pirellulaceae bacterium]